MDKITNYNYNLELFLTQYKDSEKLKGILNSADSSANDIETAIFEIQDNFNIETATGTQLDTIGLIFAVLRDGDIDEIYRDRIKEKASLTYSGEPESIITILKNTYGATSVIYRPAYPGKYYILTDVILNHSILEMISPAGVLGLFEVYILDGNGNYILDGNGNYLTCVLQITQSYLIDALGNVLVDGNGNLIYTITEL